MKVKVKYTMTGSEWQRQVFRNVTKKQWQNIVAGLRQQIADGLIEDYEVAAYPESEKEAARMFKGKGAGELPATCAEGEAW